MIYHSSTDAWVSIGLALSISSIGMGILLCLAQAVNAVAAHFGVL